MAAILEVRVGNYYRILSIRCKYWTVSLEDYVWKRKESGNVWNKAMRPKKKRKKNKVKSSNISGEGFSIQMVYVAMISKSAILHHVEYFPFSVQLWHIPLNTRMERESRHSSHRQIPAVLLTGKLTLRQSWYSTRCRDIPTHVPYFLSSTNHPSTKIT